jgi:hypothetical protein
VAACSLNGCADAEALAADELIARWSEFASGLAATQHQTGPVVVADGIAETHVVARHWLPDAQGGHTWTGVPRSVARSDPRSRRLAAAHGARRGAAEQVAAADQGDRCLGGSLDGTVDGLGT